jgi:hypothetical protein
LIIKPRGRRHDGKRYGYKQDVVIQLQEWLVREGYIYPAMLTEGGLPNFFTINGKAYPDTEPISMHVGETFRVRLHQGRSRLRVVMPTSQTTPGYITGVSKVLTVNR